MPRVSVMMPAYNRARYIAASITSVLAQTYTDWELLIVDDGSSDETLAIAQAYASRDSRIRVVQNEQNRGIAYSRNRLLALATGDYLAVLDSDDNALPDRLAVQVAYLDAHPQVGVLAMDAWLIDEHGQPKSPHTMAQGQALSADWTPWVLLWHDPFVHSSVILRASILREHRLEYPPMPPAEDYALFATLVPHTRMARLPEAGVELRIHPGNTSQLQFERLMGYVRHIQRQQFARDLGEAPSDAACELLLQLHLELNQLPTWQGVTASRETSQEAIDVLARLYRHWRGQMPHTLHWRLAQDALLKMRTITLHTYPHLLAYGVRQLGDGYAFAAAAQRGAQRLLAKLGLYQQRWP